MASIDDSKRPVTQIETEPLYYKTAESDLVWMYAHSHGVTSNR